MRWCFTMIAGLLLVGVAWAQDGQELDALRERATARARWTWPQADQWRAAVEKELGLSRLERATKRSWDGQSSMKVSWWWREHRLELERVRYDDAKDANVKIYTTVGETFLTTIHGRFATPVRGSNAVGFQVRGKQLVIVRAPRDYLKNAPRFLQRAVVGAWGGPRCDAPVRVSALVRDRFTLAAVIGEGERTAESVLKWSRPVRRIRGPFPTRFCGVRIESITRRAHGVRVVQAQHGRGRELTPRLVIDVQHGGGTVRIRMARTPRALEALKDEHRRVFSAVVRTQPGRSGSGQAPNQIRRGVARCLRARLGQPPSVTRRLK